MRRLSLACIALAIVGWSAGAVAPVLAQEEPSLFEPTPTPPPAPQAEQPKPPPPPPVAPTGPLSDRFDYERWLSMSARERQVFVEGWVAALQMAAGRIREIYLAMPVAQREPQMADFVRDYSPRRGAPAYLKEMEAIYLMESNRKLSMIDCFLQAYRRLNAR